MLDSHQLNVFLIAAETLNFTQAAQRLHMSQPSVSQHIQTLEKHFNTDLFSRAGRNLQLTDAGLALVSAAREMVRQSIQIEEMMASLQGDVYGHLVVGCSTTPGKYVLPQLLANFHRQFPKVRVTCQVTSQIQATQALCEDDIHFALTSHLEEFCREVEFRRFMCENILLIAPTNHPWAQRGTIKPQELYEADFISREEESGTYRVTREALNEIDIDISQLNTFLVLGNSEAIALAVQEGLGVGFVSSTVVERLGQDRVVSINIENLEICRDIFIGRHSGRPSTKAQSSFWNFITNLTNPIDRVGRGSSINMLLEQSIQS
jgi:DNA-binding transcriptional LysR family regulator